MKIVRPNTQGQVSGTRVVTQQAKSFRNKPLPKGLDQKTAIQQLPQEATGTAQVGVSIGLTIPGPSGSYMAARVDAWCTLPCHPDEIEAAYERATGYVQARLVVDAQEVKQFFRDL